MNRLNNRKYINTHNSFKHEININLFNLFISIIIISFFSTSAQALTISCKDSQSVFSPHFTSNATTTQLKSGPTPLQPQATPSPSVITVTDCPPNSSISAQSFPFGGGPGTVAPNGLYYSYTGWGVGTPPNIAFVYSLGALSVNGTALKDTQSIIVAGSSDNNGNATINLSNYVTSFYSPNGVNADGSFAGTSPTSTIYIKVGTIPVVRMNIYIDTHSVTPDTNCTINNNNTTNIVFPNLQTSDFVANGQPIIKAKKNVSLGIVCSGGNISSISSQFTGSEAVGNTGGAITSNPDVGIRVEDSNGATIALNTGVEPITMNNNTGTLNFSVTPYNATGGVPEVGTYTSVITVNVFIP